MDTDSLRKAFTQLNPYIGDEEWRFVSASFTSLSLKRKDYYLQEGDQQRFIGFLNKGLIREFTIDEAGNENTIWFFRENNFVVDYPSLLRGIPTRNFFRCLEACELILIPHQVIVESYQKYPAFDRFGRLIAEQVLVQLQDRIDDFHFLSAEERYLKFMETHPDLFQRISLTHLASYLGIQRPSLSRIRKKLS
jgi:CRP/FNR family transcriptional regulator